MNGATFAGGRAAARVPGRVCLLGEHNDWAGGAAVVVPMERGVTVHGEPADTLSATALFEGQSLAWTAAAGLIVNGVPSGPCS